MSDGASADLCGDNGWGGSQGLGWGEKGTTEHNAFKRLDNAARKGCCSSYLDMIKGTERCGIFEELIIAYAATLESQGVDVRTEEKG